MGIDGLLAVLADELGGGIRPPSPSTLVVAQVENSVKSPDGLPLGCDLPLRMAVPTGEDGMFSGQSLSHNRILDEIDEVQDSLDRVILRS